MSIQLIFLHIILNTFILLFIILLAYFEYGLGPVKLRPKDIKNLQNRSKQKYNNTYFADIINITESDYEDLWDSRTDYWLQNWCKHDPPTQIQAPSYINHHKDNTQIQQHKNIPFTRELSKQKQEFPISKQRITIQHQIHHTHDQEITKPHQRNLYIPQAAIHPLINNITHNQTHRRSRREIDKKLPKNNNTITTGAPTGPQDIFIEHYDCEINEISNVKYYELNKISTCKLKPMDLEMETTGVQLLSRAKAIVIKAFAVEGTIKESVDWCS